MICLEENSFVETNHTSNPFNLADNPGIEYYYVDFPKSY